MYYHFLIVFIWQSYASLPYFLLLLFIFYFASVWNASLGIINLMLSA